MNEKYITTQHCFLLADLNKFYADLKKDKECLDDTIRGDIIEVCRKIVSEFNNNKNKEL